MFYLDDANYNVTALVDTIGQVVERYAYDSYGKSYDEILKFIVRFRAYAPYNAMLVRTQMPGARFVAPAHRWSRQYGRTIKVNRDAISTVPKPTSSTRDSDHPLSSPAKRGQP